MNIYEIETPTTKQIFDAIINNEYVPLEKIKSKAKQIEVLLKDYYCTNEVLITFADMTNVGGYPIFLSVNSCLYEIASETNKDFYDLSEVERNEIVELLSYYLCSYESVFYNN